MTVAVTSAPDAMRNFLLQNLAGLIRDIITGADRVYTLHFVTEPLDDLRFADPFDDDLLVECRCFESEISARRWIRGDIASRNVRVQ